jgi:uncharacterized protein (TIGR03084 family)
VSDAATGAGESPKRSGSLLASLCGDLAAEQGALDAVLSGLTEQQWSAPTPAEGWDVRDSVSHLAFFDRTAQQAVSDPEQFAADAAELMAGTAGTPDVDLGRSITQAELYERWGVGRRRLDSALRAADPAVRVPWYGPAMSLPSFVTARLMETWAHGQDVIDAVGGPPVVSDRLRHVCHIGVGARRYAYLVHGIEDPGTPVRVEALAPRGELWSWGPEDAADRVTGTALDLALVLTQRRHRDDTDLTVAGPVAEQWISIAQSFAGPAGPGRAPGLARTPQ